ncbi:hypothetical protein LYNGBM3L_02290 [Moorena producens 3L]|uniref:Uncharacterized protein n=1 Tax=Moorena producens 3L TaxID=489825 RepID=F4XIH9_9CYAN|nr:hypothetical protein LYNGBM3L_02290 [Moorena producens 3L]
MRKGENIVGERPVPNFHRPNCYHFQLSTGDLIIYCVEHKRILWFELTEITVEVLFPKEKVDQIVTLALALMHSDPARPPQNLLQQFLSSSISIADNSQRLIFAVQLGTKLVEFILTIGIVMLMLLPQLTSSPLEEKIQPPTSESGAVTEERDQLADTEDNRSP